MYVTTSGSCDRKDLTKPFVYLWSLYRKTGLSQRLRCDPHQLLPVVNLTTVQWIEKPWTFVCLRWLSNYNWGYDPQNYFSLTGMYSSNLRIRKTCAEFKNLIQRNPQTWHGCYPWTWSITILQGWHFEDIRQTTITLWMQTELSHAPASGGRLGTTHHV